jgi:hypothetical protein
MGWSGYRTGQKRTRLNYEEEIAQYLDSEGFSLVVASSLTFCVEYCWRKL